MGFQRLSHQEGLGGLLASVTEYRSERTGLRLILANCRSGGIFRLEIVVPTAGSSDKGEPHCLEHLCFRGCERVPISGILDSLPCLSNGTNAYTATDRTVYTASTASEQGMLRLLPLYLEHLHFPVLETPAATAEASFATEIFHINEKFESAGVVFSEMETAMSEPSDIACYATLKAAYPEDSHYRWNTGGDPVIIPSLTLEDIRRTHGSYYNPANTAIVLMGAFTETDALLSILEAYEQSIYSPQHASKQASIPASLAPDVPMTAEPEPVWAHKAAPDIPVALQLVTHSPSEQDSGDHYLTYAFRLKFPWCDLRKRLALDLALKYLVEGSGAVLNERFVEGEDACAGGVEFTTDNMLWSLAVISFTDVDSAHSLTMAKEITATVRSHMAEKFDLARLRALVQREMWKQASLLETQPAKAVFDKLVSYCVNCSNSAAECPEHDLKSVIDELPIYTELLAEPESFWRGFIRREIELSEKYVVVVKPSQELAKQRTEDRKRMIARRRAENLPTFSVTANAEANEANRKKGLQEFSKAFNDAHPPLSSVEASVVPVCPFSERLEGLKPPVMTTSYDSAFTTISLAASPGALLDQSLEEILKAPSCMAELERVDLQGFVDEVLQTEMSEDIAEAIADLYKDPSWDKCIAGSSDEGGSDESDSEDLSESGSGDGDDDSESESDYAEDLGSLASDERAEVVAYQSDLATRALLQWVLRRYSGKHLLHILAKCLFYSHIQLPQTLQSELRIPAEAELIPPEALETFLNANFLDYFASNGFETSHAFNSLLTLTVKVPAESFFLALRTLQVILSCTRVDYQRLLAMAKQELSYVTESFKQGDSVVSDLHDLDCFGTFENIVSCQSYLLQNVLLRAIVAYPPVFAPLINLLLQQVATQVERGECFANVSGNTTVCQPTAAALKSYRAIFPGWLSDGPRQALPLFPSIAYYNKRLKQQLPSKLRLNLQWNEIDVGHVESAAALPQSVVPAACADPGTHLLYRHDQVLVIVESYLKATEGPIFQPVRDAGAAYSAAMSVDEEGRGVMLSLNDAAHPHLALRIARESIQQLCLNCAAILATGDGSVPAGVAFPTVEHFQQAKSATLFQMVKDLEDPSRVSEAHLDNALRRLDNNWMFAQVGAVTFREFVQVLSDLGTVFASGAFDLRAVSNSFHAAALHTADSAIEAPSDYVDAVASAILADSANKDAPHGDVYKKLLAVILKARPSVFSTGR